MMRYIDGTFDQYIQSKHTGAETTYPHRLGTRLFWGTRATNFSIYTTKMKGAGPQIIGTGAKSKRVPCQKSCRVNRAYDCATLHELKCVTS